MKWDNPHISILIEQVERTFASPVRTSIDFELLRASIQKRVGDTVGVSTLKRLFGYIGRYAGVRESTPCVLCRYVGYPDWNTFVADYCQVESRQTSHRIVASTLESSDLSVGAHVVIEWHPDRQLRLRYDGQGFYEVVASRNAKLVVGDRFHCERFVMNQPLYVDQMTHGTDQPALFVMGKQGGLSKVEVE